MEQLDQQKIAKFLRAFCLAKHLRNDSIPCEIDQGLYLGSIGAAYNKAILQRLNITHILIVANSVEMPFLQDFKYMRIDVLDSPDVNLMQHFEVCFNFIDEAREKGNGVLVHCFAGRSRSVTVVLAYLLSRKGLTFNQALEIVKSKRPGASPNAGFIEQLHRFELQLSGTRTSIASETSTRKH